MAKEKHAGGRPPKYKKEYAEQAKKICKLGATDKQLADIFQVSEATIYNWKNKHPEFLEATKAGKLSKVEQTEQSLHNKANGFTHPEEKIFIHNGEVIRVKTERYYPPSDKAIIYSLNNLAPEKYRNQPTVIIPGDAEAYEKLRDLYGKK